MIEKKFNILRGILASGALAAVLSGCATPGEMQMATELAKGRYDKVIRDFEADGGYANLAPGRDGFSRLGGVCEAYFRLRDHVNYEDCAERLAARPIPASHQASVSPMSMEGMFLVRKAMLAIELGNFDKALQYAEESIPLVEQGSEINWYERIRAYRAAGIAAALLERDQLAESYVKKVSSVHHEFSDMDRHMVSTRRLGKAAIYTAQKNYPAVVATFEAPDDTKVDFNRVMDAITTLGLSEVLDAAMEEAFSDWFSFENFPLNYMYAKALYETGRIDEARQAYDDALASPIAPNFGSIYYSILADRGRIAEEDGQIEEAIAHLRRAVDEIERRRKSLNTEASKIGFVGDKQAIYGDLIRLLIQRGRAAEAFEYAERGKARALVDLLAARDDLGVTGRDAGQAASLLAELERQEAQLTASQLVSELSQAETRGLEDAKARLAAEAPELASLVTVLSESASEIRTRLGPDEQLVEYFYQPGGDIFAFLVARDNVQAFVLDGEQIEFEIAAFRRAVQNPTVQGWSKWSEALYHRLVTPWRRILRRPTSSSCRTARSITCPSTPCATAAAF